MKHYIKKYLSWSLVILIIIILNGLLINHFIKFQKIVKLYKPLKNRNEFDLNQTIFLINETYEDFNSLNSSSYDQMKEKMEQIYLFVNYFYSMNGTEEQNSFFLNELNNKLIELDDIIFNYGTDYLAYVALEFILFIVLSSFLSDELFN